MKVRMIVALSLFTGINAPAQATIIYRNDFYEFQVAIPYGSPACTGMPPAPDHGIGIMLDRARRCLDINDEGRWIVVQAYANAAESSTSAADIAEEFCSTKERGGRRRPPPPKLAIQKHRSASCRVDRPNGQIEVTVATQLPVGGYLINRTNYSATLYTYADNFDDDVMVLRDVLDGIDIFGPPPP